MQVGRDASMYHVKINTPFFVALFFEYLISQVRINKAVKEKTVDYYPSP